MNPAKNLCGESGYFRVVEKRETMKDVDDFSHYFNAAQKLTERVRVLTQALRDEANQLERWATESRAGGWSTHQVDPMNARAAELRKIADAE